MTRLKTITDASSALISTQSSNCQLSPFTYRTIRFEWYKATTTRNVGGMLADASMNGMLSKSSSRGHSNLHWKPPSTRNALLVNFDV